MKKMNKILMTLLLSLMVLSAALPAHAASLPMTVESFKLDGIDLTENAVNRLDLQRDRAYTAELRFTPTDFVKNAQVRVFASGFEYSDVSPIEDTSKIFDADANVTYVKHFTLKLTDQVQEDDYKIRIIFSDRYNNELVKTYNVKIDVQRHLLKVVDVVFYPADAVQAGNALLSTVRIENQGEKVEDDVRVEVSIPALGVSGVDYIDQIKNNGNQEKGTEEIFLRIPDCAKPGRYEVMIKAWYNQLHDVSAAKGTIEVLENPICAQKAQPARTVPETVVIYKSDAQNGSKTAAQTATTQAAQKTAEPVKADTVSTGSTFEKIRDALEVTLLVLIALPVVIAAVLAFRGLNKENDSL